MSAQQTVTVTVTITDALRLKCRSIVDALNISNVERDTETRSLVAAAIAGQHSLLLGPPGTGKSKLIDDLVIAFSATSFDYLMTRFTEPSEVFGPLRIKRLAEEGRHDVDVSGRLADVEIAFLDEVFKSNSAILNALLKVLNERRYFNDGAWRPVPLRFMACASNEVPEDGDTSVEAFYDRILVRHVVKPIEDDCNLNRVLDGDLPPMTPALMAIAELDQARVLARATPLHDTARIARADIRRELTAKGVRVSDRRWGQATNYCRAVAWLGGQAEVTRSTLMHLVPCLWSRPEHIPLVDEVVKRHAPSWESEVRVVMTAVSEQRAVLSRVDGMGHEPALSAIGSARAALDDLDADLDAIAGRHLGADVTPSKATITQLRGDLLARIVAVMQAPSKAVRR